MPKVLEVKGYKFFFYSSEGDEPCHIHVKRGDGDGKIWLEPDLKEEYLEDFKAQEKKDIMKIVEENKNYLIWKWYEYFNGK
ncbi:MAG: DUF4160 domain-containing protein [Mangrovibacterium sp.]|nr:DUF4160 domain-containing protein [Mangrovibacterium sp.]